MTVTLDVAGAGIATMVDSVAYGASGASGSLRQLNPGGTVHLRLSTVLEGDRDGDGPKHRVFGDRAIIRVSPRVRIYEVRASPSRETFVHVERCFPFQAPLAAEQSFELHCTRPPE